ncbi:MAG: glycosyltransferase [Chloroflexia bacterium]
MRVLFLALEPPFPPNDGGRIRTYNILKQVARRHEVTLVTFAQAGQDQERLAALRGMCREVIPFDRPPAPARTLPRKAADFFRRRPACLGQYRSLALETALRRWAVERAFDVVHVDQILLAQYAEALRPLPAVLTHHNIEAEVQRRQIALDRQMSPWRRLRAWIECRRWRHFELSASRRFGALACVSERDAAYFRRYVPEVPAVVVPNGVDTQAFRPVERDGAEPVLLYSGRMDYPPNVDAVRWFGDEILPQVQRAVPAARLLIVGRDPTPEVRALAGRPGIQVTGTVPDVRPYYAQAALYVVPLRFGAGTRLKILEAMAMGMPIVSTSLGSEGLDLVSGEDLVEADSAPAFARAVVELLGDGERRARLGRHARRTVEARFDWSQIALTQEEAYRLAMDRNG